MVRWNAETRLGPLPSGSLFPINEEEVTWVLRGDFVSWR
jgi:hypothetical protein